MEKYNNLEFYDLIQPILDHKEFQKLKKIKHHGISRFDHCMRVSYYTYLVAKGFGLNYKEATVAALLHDFFTDEVSDENSISRLRKHPSFAVENAKKYFALSPLQEDIILRHMFPVTLTPPKYLESWIVDFIDDLAAIYEQSHSTRRELSAATTFLFLFLIQYFKMR